MMKVVTVIFVGIAIMLFVAAFMSLPVMLLWDWLMPMIFGLPQITWLQAWGLMVLCSLLFKSHAVSTRSES